MTSWIESIDVEAYVKQLMQKETDQISKTMQKKLMPLQTNQTALKAKISSYGQLQTLIDTFNQKIKTFTTTFQPSYNVTSSNSAVASATINGTGVPGNHNLTVTQIAQSTQIASSNIYTSNNDALGMTNTLTIGVGATSFNLDINPGDSLQTIVTNINNAASNNNIGGVASVINTGANQYRLIIASTKTGVENDITISETGSGSNAFGISTGVSGTGQVLTQATNAVFTLDTLAYNLPSNTNNISGLNISIMGTGSTVFSVTGNDTTSSVKSSLVDTINAYNDIMNFVAQTQVINQAANRSPDATLNMVQSLLKTAITNSTNLVPLGIVAVNYNEAKPVTAVDKDGNIVSMRPTGLLQLTDDLVTDQTFIEKLQANFTGIQAQLVGENGDFTKISNMLVPTTGSITKLFNDAQFGFVKKANEQLNNVNDQIAEIQSNADAQKKALLLKYGQLSMMLTKLQAQTIYVSQQIQAMNK